MAVLPRHEFTLQLTGLYVCPNGKLTANLGVHDARVRLPVYNLKTAVLAPPINEHARTVQDSLATSMKSVQPPLSLKGYARGS